MIKKDSSFSESMSKKQLLALIKCKDCLQSLKDESWTFGLCMT
jgi:hypothetical protein